MRGSEPRSVRRWGLFNTDGKLEAVVGTAQSARRLAQGMPLPAIVCEVLVTPCIDEELPVRGDTGEPLAMNLENLACLERLMSNMTRDLEALRAKVALQL